MRLRYRDRILFEGSILMKDRIRIGSIDDFYESSREYMNECMDVCEIMKDPALPTTEELVLENCARFQTSVATSLMLGAMTLPFELMAMTLTA
jgi:hypothetical protein